MDIPQESLKHKCAGHAPGLLRSLHSQLRSQQFCDVKIQVSGQLFQAHRNVLCAASPYFCAMFTGNLKEADKDLVALHGVTGPTFRNVLSFIYSGEVEVTRTNCQDLLSAADMFGLSDMLEVCCDFMKGQLHPSNCIGIHQYADAHGCVDVKEASADYIQSHFVEVVAEEEYTSLHKAMVTKLLRSEQLQIDNELQVFKAAIKWILHDVTVRRRFVYELMDNVRIPIISAKQVERAIGDCPDLSLRIALNKLVRDYHGDPKPSVDLRLSRVRPYLYQPRERARKSIYMVGGYSRDPGGRWSDSQSLATVECFSSVHQFWKCIPPLRHARSGHGVVVLNGLVYAVGGESDSLIFDSVERYDPATYKWTMLPSMTAPRCGLGLCVIHGKIYAVGGWIGSEIGNTIECFDPHLNTWSHVGKVDTLRFAMGVVEHEGLMYLIGGMSDLGSELRSVESYNPVTREWSRLADMDTPRAYVGVSVMDNHIYAVGGWNETSGALNTLEVYSIEKDQWRHLVPMSCACAGSSVATVNGLLYVIGGRSSSDEFTAPFTLDSVECYDPQTESWMSVGPMPSSRCEAGIAVL